YTGQMRGGQFHGFGRQSWAAGWGGTHDGLWIEGKSNGHGIQKFGDGRIFEGQWKDGKRGGTFICTRANGTRSE
ncbi:hypothetical protein B484DRAFT_318268, partial [Ochromonadaceae sp. CCMP2298]